jgi:predicted RNase H-like HicB family nuclease
MLTSYIRSAMRRATYEILADGTFYGEIPGFQGVWANSATLEGCRDELQEVLEGWIVLGLQTGHPLPVVDGVEITMQSEISSHESCGRRESAEPSGRNFE